MPLISSSHHTDIKSGWSFKITDQGTIGKNKFNPTKLNMDGLHRICQHANCRNVIRASRNSGLCDNHQTHSHDLLFGLIDPANNQVSIPKHIEIINHLVNWAKSRNYNLTPLFSALSFSLLGNIPDVSTLAGETTHAGFTPPVVQDLFNEAISIVDDFFPDNNNSSYQPLITSKGQIPARVLAVTFAGLILCEEANRGDRWFWRQIRKDEQKTTYLGGAMPIAYYAAVSFPWGLEIGKAADKLTPSP
jgi:hypothetical protein